MRNFLSNATTLLAALFTFPQKVLFLPLLAAALMLLSGFLPWLHDPLGLLTTAWQVSVDTGWQIHSPFLNYGLLCTFVAASICFMTVAYSFFPIRRFPALVLMLRMHIIALFCLMPVSLFLGQMVCCDFPAMTLLAHHSQQALLIQRLFLYSSADQLLPLRPFVVYDSSLWGRLQLLIDYLDYGSLLPFFACCFLVFWIRFSRQKLCFPSTHQPSFRRRAFLLPLALLFLFFLIFVRAFLGILFEKQAQSALASGSYSSALSLLHTASLFLPELNAATFYHLELGQALYYLSPQRLSPDAQAYLAASYRTQRDYLSAFQQDYALWKISPSTLWISYELSGTLEAWIDSLQPLKSNARLALNQSASSLPWLQILERVDPTNVYALYLDGRISYAFQDYAASLLPFSRLLLLSREPAILSSVYTYLAFCKMGLGDSVAGRALLFKALTFDPGYRNNLAREALSGLH